MLQRGACTSSGGRRSGEGGASAPLARRVVAVSGDVLCDLLQHELLLHAARDGEVRDALPQRRDALRL